MTVSQTAVTTTANGRGWSIGHFQSIEGRSPIASNAGRTSAKSAQRRMTEAMTISKIVSTISVGVSVVYVVPLHLVLDEDELHGVARACRAIALTPTPAKYAPVTWPSGTRVSGTPPR